MGAWPGAPPCFFVEAVRAAGLLLVGAFLRAAVPAALAAGALPDDFLRPGFAAFGAGRDEAAADRGVFFLLRFDLVILLTLPPRPRTQRHNRALIYVIGPSGPRLGGDRAGDG